MAQNKSKAGDTIFALSSGRGVSAVAVIRISGPRAGEALQILAGRMPAPRMAGFATIRTIEKEPIDEALVLWFPAPNSETGEDTAELQIHGGRATVAATLAALGQLKGLRLAEPGEFTRRAFENGKLDLTKVEGLADLVMAETEAQRRQALLHLKGLLGDKAEAWRGRLIGALALVEARIDFSDEADVPEDLLTPARRVVRDLADEIAKALGDGKRGERLREGLVVAIAGPPNAGKSTLLNRIARREAAIVSPYAGTTRDVIEVHLDLEGQPVTLLDTAGIRPTDDPVELEGVRRAQQRASAADLILWVVDAAGPAAGRPEADLPNAVAPIWTIENKADLLSASNEQEPTSIGAVAPRFMGAEQRLVSSERLINPSVTTSGDNSLTSGAASKTEHKFSRNEPLSEGSPRFRISAGDGAGIEPLLAALTRQAAVALGNGESALLTRERHRQTLETALAALRRALAEPAASREDLMAEELRLAATALGKLTGRIDVEDILDVIFRDFCIGK
ncbi:MAG TPA: tRNA uridine-5-carboxymethylaminomethyl(34) synthesis GTPase MnmE [Pseudolabrys sp.]|nr:tRNA uridine-5-carboxymethylaminomethyl(34) synthesis GTPase MnmE [Pseudolabrys sp.]